jgi:GAF domain-containing protein
MTGSEGTRERRRSNASRGAEAALAAHFVSLADALVADDVVDLLDRLVASCVKLTSVTAAGILLSDQRGDLQLMASSSEEARLLELLQLQNREGPCLDAFRARSTVSVDVLSAEAGRWPRFSEAAIMVGFRHVHALPLLVHGEVIGGLNLFRDDPVPLTEAESDIARALAHVAGVGVVQQRAAYRSSVLAEQLQKALDSRIVIEQAKGMLAEHGKLPMDAAFGVLRSYARNGNHKLVRLAEAVVRGDVDLAQLAPRG